MWVFNKKQLLLSQVLVAHAYNHSYSGGRDQKDRGLKPAWANSSKDSYLGGKKNHYKKRVVECLKV
jgi:hypothetical protein